MQATGMHIPFKFVLKGGSCQCCPDAGSTEIHSCRAESSSSLPYDMNRPKWFNIRCRTVCDRSRGQGNVPGRYRGMGAYLILKIYHFSGIHNYGTTKNGAYMCEMPGWSIEPLFSAQLRSPGYVCKQHSTTQR
jgi:hypothetical protein